jgi:non-reducing end alpha-L-arabinofuranosidase
MRQSRSRARRILTAALLPLGFACGCGLTGSIGDGDQRCVPGEDAGRPSADASVTVDAGQVPSRPDAGGTPDAGQPKDGGSPSSPPGPCDLYAAGSTPCVAAHSTTRALYRGYTGNLYQVRRASDGTTKDIGVVTPAGCADAAAQDAFCSGTTCTISIIYDQSPNANHLTKTPPGGWLNNGGLEADATAAKVKLNGHTVYGVYTTMNWNNDVGAVGYRNNHTKGVATGDEPEAMYMVASGRRYNQRCCFDYGKAETNNKDNGPATMEAVYFGNSTQWGRGSGSGPWVMADLEDGVYAGDSTAASPTNTSLVADYVTAMLKGHSGNHYALKGGDAQSGSLTTLYDGPRPKGYSPQKKEGAIILGIGGDNSHTGEGTFFEGCMTSGVSSDATDDAVQANIVAARYGR